MEYEFIIEHKVVAWERVQYKVFAPSEEAAKELIFNECNYIGQLPSDKSEGSVYGDPIVYTGRSIIDETVLGLSSYFPEMPNQRSIIMKKDGHDIYINETE